LDILSCARVSADSEIRVDSIVQQQFSNLVEQCSKIGQCNLAVQSAAFFPFDKGAKLRPFASCLSAIEGYGLYKQGNVMGYATGCVPTFPLMSAALTKFDCCRPIKEISSIGNVSSFQIVKAGNENVVFEKGLDVAFLPLNFQFEAVGVVHCGAFKFGVCTSIGRVDILNEALYVQLDSARIGDRYMFAKDFETNKWIINDMDGPDKNYRLSLLYARFGMKVKGVKITYQFDLCGITISYANLKMFEMISDSAQPVSCGKDIILQKVFQRINANMFGFDFCDHFVSLAELSEVNFLSLLSEVSGDDNMYLREQYVEMLSLIEAERVKRVESSSLVKFRDAMIPVVSRCRSLLGEAVASAKFEEMENLACYSAMNWGGVSVSIMVHSDYHEPVSQMLCSNVLELHSQAPCSNLVTNHRGFHTLGNLHGALDEDQIFVNMTHHTFVDRIFVQFLDLCSGQGKNLIFMISGPRCWLVSKFPDFLACMAKCKMRVIHSFIGTSWSSYYCLIQSEGGYVVPGVLN
jgi:hypothetical protein